MNKRSPLIAVLTIGCMALLLFTLGLVVRPTFESFFPCGIFNADHGVFLYSQKGLQGDRLFFREGDDDIPSNFEAKSLLECPNGEYHIELRDHTNRPGYWDCSTDLPIDWRNEGGKAVSIKVDKHSTLKKDCPKYP